MRTQDVSLAGLASTQDYGKQEDEKAVEAAREAINLDPDSAMARNNLAVALYFKGEYKESHQNMLNAKELGYSVDPRFAEALEKNMAGE